MKTRDINNANLELIRQAIKDEIEITDENKKTFGNILLENFMADYYDILSTAYQLKQENNFSKETLDSFRLALCEINIDQKIKSDFNTACDFFYVGTNTSEQIISYLESVIKKLEWDIYLNIDDNKLEELKTLQKNLNAEDQSQSSDFCFSVSRGCRLF